MRRSWIDLESLEEKKPGNEGMTHFMLKIAAKAWVWEVLGARIIATEIDGLWSRAALDEDKSHVIEMVGKKRARLQVRVCPYCGSKLENMGFAVGLRCREWGCNRRFWSEGRRWWTTRRRSPSRRSVVDVLGIGDRAATQSSPKMLASRGVEVKSSLADFRSGFCRGADFTYVMAPQNVVPVQDVPKGVGLVEADLSKLRIQIEPLIAVRGVRLVRKARFVRDERFKSHDAHQTFLRSMIDAIARRNTLEMMRNGFALKEEEVRRW